MMLLLVLPMKSQALVGIMDGPINCNHKELRGHCVSLRWEEMVPTKQVSLHGTHVAGIVSGKTKGIYKNSGVVGYQLFKMLGGPRGNYIWLGDMKTHTGKTLEEEAIIDGKLRGVTVMSQSYGNGPWVPASTIALWSRHRTMTFVRAGGNDGSYIIADAAIPDNVILVGAVNKNNKITSWSNAPGEEYKYHWVMAPGQSILSADENNGYIHMSGTSMSTPYVSGIVGELHDRYPQYRHNPVATKRIILTTATDLGAPGVDKLYGYGLVNRNRAVLTLGKITYTPPVVVPDRQAPQVQVSDRFALQFVPGPDGTLDVPNMKYSFTPEFSFKYLDWETPALSFQKKGFNFTMAYSRVEDQPEVYYTPMLSAGVSYFKEWDVSKKTQLAFDAEIPMFTFKGESRWDKEVMSYREDPTFQLMLKWKGTFN